MNVFLFVSLIVGSIQVYADAPTPPPLYTTLETRRPLIKPAVYSADDRQTVADQANLLISDMYVHRKLKETAFHVDPIPALAQVVSQAPQLQDDALHSQLAKIFLDERDAHTNYYLPKEVSCYSSFLPFVLDEITDPVTSKLGFAITKILNDPAIVALAPQESQLTIGDVLVSYDGVAPLAQVKKLAEMGDGATHSGRILWAMHALYYRYHIMQPLPDSNSVKMTFRKQTGEMYSLELPWLSKANLVCLGFDTSPKEAKLSWADQGDNRYQTQYEDLFKPRQRQHLLTDVSNPDSDLSSPIKTKEPIVSYKIIKNTHGTFGYLRLDSFAPKTLNLNDTLALIKDLLNNEFAQTNGLFIDLRDNGGGQISFGEDMIQLFTPVDVETEGFTMVASATNEFYLSASNSNPLYLAAVRDALKLGAPMTIPLKLSSIIGANRLGQSYFKPVSILTNSGCYSTCDMFTSGMQDHEAALIWAEDGNTGGGGANVVTQSGFEKSLPASNKGSFKPLPGGQDMRIAWRQAVRVKTHAGVLIENVGAVSDRVIQETLVDVTQSNRAQVEVITAELAKRASSYAGSVYFNDSLAFDITAGQALEIPAQVTDTDSVLYLVKNQVVDQQSLKVGSTQTLVSLKISTDKLASFGNIDSLELIGQDASSKRVWRKVITYRITAPYIQLPVSLNLKGMSLDPLTIYTVASDQTQGWKLVGGVMRVGDGPNYLDGTHTMASAFLDLSTQSKALLSFTMELHSEQDYDFFKAVVVANGAETQVVAPMSGDVASQTYNIDLAQFVGQKIEVRLVFDSDDGVNAVGPSITMLQVQ